MDLEEYDFELRYQDDLDALNELENDGHSCDGFQENLSSNRNDQAQSVQGRIETERSTKPSTESQRLQGIRNNDIYCDLSSSEGDTNNEDTESRIFKRAKNYSDPMDVEYVFNAANLSEVKKSSRVLKRIPPGAYVSNTTADGTRVYMRLLNEDEINYKEPSRTHGFPGYLLPTSCREFRLQLEQERELKFLQPKSIANSNAPDPRDSSLVNSDNDINHDNQTESDLWVEKFKPKAYLDLLSDTGTNRLLLRWLKLWDKVVFNKEVKLKCMSDKVENQPQSKQKQFKKKILPEVHKELDSINRPLQKVALLCGSPGLGKTTLAHVIAKHAGYNIVEMNASDDRTPEAFQTQIEAATQMRAVIGEEPKPNCLIIDEIDGAPLPSINLLVSIIASKPQENSNKGKKKKHKNMILLRPIICICNDQYVPALRQLRSCALVLNFPPTLPSRLASRLLEISCKQNLKTDSSTLLALCEKADNDIRSCLATLQFVYNKKKQLRIEDVCSLTIGQKDMQKNLLSIWHEVFHIQRTKRKRVAENENFICHIGHDLQTPARDDSSLTVRYQKIQTLVQSYGDIEKIHHGLFSNYLLARSKDPFMEMSALGVDWLCCSDMFLEAINHSQHYLLMGYLPFAAVMFNFLFASDISHKIAFPTDYFEYKTKSKTAVNLLETLMNELSPSLYTFFTLSTISMDFLPFLRNIIQPQLRPINVQLYTSQEKEDLKRLIDIMIAYNLTYKQELMPDGQVHYRIDPCIDLLASYLDMNNNQQLTHAAKQLIAREIELEKLRRSISTPEVKVVQSVEPKHRKEPDNMPNHKQVLQPKNIVCQEKPLRDFFGRVITRPTKTNLQGISNEVSRQPDIWFHFKEGYSNAVRKHIYMKDLC